MHLDIIFEDAYCLCVLKPNNMVVHHAYHSRSVADETSLLQWIQEVKGIKAYPIHRLDRKTSRTYHPNFKKSLHMFKT